MCPPESLKKKSLNHLYIMSLLHTYNIHHGGDNYNCDLIRMTMQKMRSFIKRDYYFCLILLLNTVLQYLFNFKKMLTRILFILDPAANFNFSKRGYKQKEATQTRQEQNKKSTHFPFRMRTNTHTNIPR